MTGTFHLTGRILDKSKQPVARANLVLAGSIRVVRDGTANEIYAPTPRITTNDTGYLCVADADGVPSGTAGVDLIVGVQYRLRAASSSLLDPLVFSDSQATAGALDLADVVPENPTPDTTWTFALNALTARVTALEAGGGGGGGAVSSVAGRTGAVVLTSTDVGLGNVTNTSDANKPVSTAQAAADAAVQAAAIAAAATDATTKANAAQAAAVQRANHTGTQSADTLTDGTTNKAFLATERTKLTGIATGATANLTDATLLARANHTGTQSADTLTDGTTNKAFLATERTKLSGIATGATANSTDATLLARANHTGTQAVGTITGLGALATKSTVGVADHSATGTPSSTTFLRGDNTWATPAGGGGATPGLLIGSQFAIADATNAAQGFTLNTEYCWGFILPGSGTLDSLAVEVMSGGDASSVLRIGVRTNNAGRPSATVAYETTVAATASSTPQVTGLSIPYGASGSEILWLSLTWQGGTSVSPNIQKGNPVSPLYFQGTTAAGYGATGVAALGWVYGALSQSLSGTMAAAGTAPGALTAWAGSVGGLPHIFVRRGT